MYPRSIDGLTWIKDRVYSLNEEEENSQKLNLIIKDSDIIVVYAYDFIGLVAL